MCTGISALYTCDFSGWENELKNKGHGSRAKMGIWGVEPPNKKYVTL